MTLTRPAFQATIENIDTGWNSTTYSGEIPDPDAGVWLADGLELSWRFESPPPSQLEPETAKFAIIADGYANLPEFDLGDIVRVVLERPTLTDPITYMEFVGRVTDVPLVTVAKTGRVRMDVIAVDPTSEVANRRNELFDDDDATSEPGWVSGSVEVAYFAAVTSYAICKNYVQPINYFANSCLLRHEPDKTFSTAVREVLAAGIQGTPAPGTSRYPVQRYAKDPLGGDWFQWDLYTTSSPVPPLPWIFYLAHWETNLSGPLPALFEYAYGTAGDDVTAMPVTSAVDPDSSVIVLDASVLADSPKWTKDRSASPNSIGIIGRDFATGEATPARYVADDASIERYGLIQRPELDTGIPEAFRTWIGERYLRQVRPNANSIWISDDFTIKTHVMDDAELDAYAPLFWTVREPIPEKMGRRVVVRNVSDTVDPTGDLYVTHLAGATFTCRGGHLEIKPELTPAPLTSEIGKSAGPTFDEFGASAFGNATYHDQGGSTDYIAAALTYEKAKLTSL